MNFNTYSIVRSFSNTLSSPNVRNVLVVQVNVSNVVKSVSYLPVESIVAMFKKGILGQFYKVVYVTTALAELSGFGQQLVYRNMECIGHYKGVQGGIEAGSEIRHLFLGLRLLELEEKLATPVPCFDGELSIFIESLIDRERWVSDMYANLHNTIIIQDKRGEVNEIS